MDIGVKVLNICFSMGDINTGMVKNKNNVVLIICYASFTF